MNNSCSNESTTLKNESTELCPRPSMTDIRELDAASLTARMHIGLQHLDPRIVELDQHQVAQAWRAEAGVGTWPIRVLIGHLADAEIVLSHRMRKIIAEENPTLSLWDEHAFIDGGIYGCTDGSTLLPPMGGDLAMIHTTRSWIVALLMQLDENQWNRTGLHPTDGPISVRWIANYSCWHLEHHAWFVNRKIESLLGPLPEPEPCSDQGCGKPSCACKPQ